MSEQKKRFFGSLLAGLFDDRERADNETPESRPQEAAAGKKSSVFGGHPKQSVFFRTGSKEEQVQMIKDYYTYQGIPEDQIPPEDLEFIQGGTWDGPGPEEGYAPAADGPNQDEGDGPEPQAFCGDPVSLTGHGSEAEEEEEPEGQYQYKESEEHDEEPQELGGERDWENVVDPEGQAEEPQYGGKDPEAAPSSTPIGEALEKDMAAAAVSIDAIELDPRLDIIPPLSEEERAELRESLDTLGQLSPITVEELPDGRYRLIDGRHRLEEIRAGGKQEVLARIYTFAEDDWATRLAQVFALNTKRRSLTGPALLRGIIKLHEKNIQPKTIARIVQKPIRTVHAYIAVGNGATSVQHAFAAGGLSLWHAEILAQRGVSDAETIEAAKRIVREDLKVWLDSREKPARSKTRNTKALPQTPLALELRERTRKTGARILTLTVAPGGAEPEPGYAGEVVKTLRHVADEIEQRFWREPSA